MSGKFMKVKRIIIPTITMVIIASQLMGCGAVTQNELVQMLKAGEQIEINVYEPEYIQDEQGEQDQLIWEQLALLETNPQLRKSWDNTLGIIGSQESKNGILYVNESGKQDINNTLRVALHNTEFQKILSADTSDSTLSALANAATSNYADLEITDANNRNEVMKAIYMAVNGYFNLLPDNVPNYCNADSTITRAQFMAMVFRADTQVQELESDGVFTNIVGQSEYNLYAQGVKENSYLDLEYKGLNPKTYNNNITRGEVIYILVSRYYNTDLQLLDIKTSAVSFTDCKNAGNIAANQKAIKDATTKDYWKSYELAYALKNPDNGVPEEIYKAMIVAQQNGLISNETRWDEACTLSEAIELLIKALLNEKGIPTYTAKLGTTLKAETSTSLTVESNIDYSDPIIESEYDKALIEQVEKEERGETQAEVTTPTPAPEQSTGKIYPRPEFLEEDFDLDSIIVNDIDVSKLGQGGKLDPNEFGGYVVH